MTTPLGERLAEMGYRSSHEYLRRWDGVSYVDAAKATGFPAIALINLARRECRSDDDHFWFLRDSLAREVLSICVHGWKAGRNPDSVAAHAVAAWVSLVEPLGDRWGDYAEERSGAIYRSTEIPVGWRPSGADDSVILSFLDASSGARSPALIEHKHKN